MQCLLRLNEDNGALLSTRSPFIDAEYKNNFWKVYVGGANKTEINTKVVINAARLNAIKISNQIKSYKEIPLSNPVKGIYLRYSGKSPISHIVYPSLVPGKIEERVDATPDLNKSLRFGPSVEKEEITNTDDYSINTDITNNIIANVVNSSNCIFSFSISVNVYFELGFAIIWYLNSQSVSPIDYGIAMSTIPIL